MSNYASYLTLSICERVPGWCSRYSDCYELDDEGIEFRWGRGFPHPSRPALGPTQPPVQWYPFTFPGVNWPGRGVNHPPTSTAEVKEGVELYLYSPLWVFMACSATNLPFNLKL